MYKQSETMGTKEKLITRFKQQPKDFTYDELFRLFKIYGFEINTKGSTSGSRVEFRNEELNISYGAHKPHPNNTIKGYVMKQVLEFLVNNNLIK